MPEAAERRGVVAARLAAVADRLAAVADRLDGIEPPPLSAWLFALRIWLAMMLALYAAFWLELESASSAAVTVAILAQPRRGQAIAKALYRFLGTLLGFGVAILLTALFAQDRVLMLVGFGLWLGLCVFTASYLQGVRAYGAMLSGYTVAIIAISNIDAPQNVFEVGVARTAAITIGIIAITFINDALGAPSVYADLRDGLARAGDAVRDFSRRALADGDPGPEEAAAVLRQAAAQRDAIGVVGSEFHDGAARAAGARSAVAALFAAVTAARSLALAAALGASPDADAVRARARAGLAGDRAALPALEAGLDAAVRDGTPDAVLLHRRAVDLLRQDALARDGCAALETGRAPARDVGLPVHRDFPDALRNAARVVITFAISAALFILSGWPATSSALLQVSAFAALAAINPNPVGFATGALIGMPLAAAAAGIVEFVVLDGAQGFPLLAIAVAPVVFLACFLSLRPATAGIGFILLVFFPVVLAPANPQPYDPESYINASVLFCVSGVILYLTIRLVLPTTDAQHRDWSLRAARADLIGALTGTAQEADARVVLDSDRLVQFAGWRSACGAAHRASLRHAFALAALDVAAAGAQAGLDRLAAEPGLGGPVSEARGALARADAEALAGAATRLLAAGRDASAPARGTVSSVVADLIAASYVIAGQGRALRRLDIWGAG
ncbi:p-hydroxybenzoic acid efflux pump subunit AaeB [Methylobacterium crusticola]|uniref:p-hydroxybenzoic acid efflux pump subunit AaeB n=3 Tax=Methylobacterium crusticola TaxID=1697972 RepID=A0ABQ4QXV1_9HYPH|nr:FUSC family protein [Methylobacterium crusticola]GJD49555.1 p-hydroxybenzoic acid efflux pump subunit AaeB [Methylobacterium crusticola]